MNESFLKITHFVHYVVRQLGAISVSILALQSLFRRTVMASEDGDNACESRFGTVLEGGSDVWRCSVCVTGCFCNVRTILPPSPSTLYGCAHLHSSAAARRQLRQLNPAHVCKFIKIDFDILS